VWQTGDRLAQQLNQLDTRVSNASSDAVTRLQGDATEVNGLLNRIADLNKQILASGGNSATDLQDARDTAIDQLSAKLSVKVISHDDGTVTVLGEGSTLVDRFSATQLTVTNSGSGVTVQDSSGVTLTVPGGSMGGLLEFTNVRVPAMRGQLNQLAAAIVSQVNTIHRTGYTPTGTTNTDFFDPAGVTAGTIRLAAPVQASSAAIAAGGTNHAGDGTVAQQLADLASSAIPALSGRTFRDYYSGVATDLGTAVQSTGADADVQQTLVDQADQRRSAVSGVSVDEEMVNLIAQQQAYGAAAKLVTTADQMIQTLLNSIVP
ncbi:MAG TPA: flagellar hook-associated protein FlgK, partial [Dongiaceae bacterium]|nr:flagellar hook-associated protein FlgK [Dongiaceae bacterium]